MNRTAQQQNAIHLLGLSGLFARWWASICLLMIPGLLIQLHAATTVFGSVSGTWTQTDSPYLVAGDLHVASSDSLIIQSNVQVHFQGAYGFEVRPGGVLKASGTKANPVVFAPADAQIPWNGIFFNESGSGSFLRYCRISGSHNSGFRIKNTSAGQIMLEYCDITGNESKSASGGGVAIEGNATLLRCLIAGNSTPNPNSMGGGVAVFGAQADVLFDSCRILGNSTTHAGGGVGVQTTTSDGLTKLRMVNCIVRSNSVVDGYASGVHLGGNTYGAIVNCTIIDNVGGPGIYSTIYAQGGLNLTNSIVWRNDGQIAGPNYVEYSCIQEWPNTDNGIKTSDPLLDPVTSELGVGSPCIDAGHPNSVFNDRFIDPPSRGGVRNDMGAYGGPGACGLLEPPMVISHPQDQAAFFGTKTTFTVVATGAEPLSYQWHFNGEPISGATAAQYVIDSVRQADAGTYCVVVSNPADSETSQEAILEVPHTATATPILVNGFVVGYNLTDPGFGYTNAPSVRILGGGGSNATAIAKMTGSRVTGLDPANPGRGYADTPVVVIAPPFIPQPTMDIAALSLLSFSNLAVGTNYQLEYLSGGQLSAVGVPFTATSSSYTQLVPGTASMNSYRLTRTPAPIQARAEPVVVNGFVVDYTVTEGGSDYTTAPAVIVSGGGCSNVTAHAIVEGGRVTAVVPDNPGCCCTNAPSVSIALPPSTSLSLDSVTQVMELHLESLSPYDNYQLEFTPAVTGGWSDLNAPFAPTSTTSTQQISVSGNPGFFRVRYVPSL